MQKGIIHFGKSVSNYFVNRMAPIVYKPEGQRIAKLLWEETMEELSFARVRDILEQLKE